VHYIRKTGLKDEQRAMVTITSPFTNTVKWQSGPGYVHATAHVLWRNRSARVTVAQNELQEGTCHSGVGGHFAFPPCRERSVTEPGGIGAHPKEVPVDGVVEADERGGLNTYGHSFIIPVCCAWTRIKETWPCNKVSTLPLKRSDVCRKKKVIFAIWQIKRDKK
jgi:hypothetical protein